MCKLGLSTWAHIHTPTLHHRFHVYNVEQTQSPHTKYTQKTAQTKNKAHFKAYSVV
jgi:hypothetical protein